MISNITCRLGWMNKIPEMPPNLLSPSKDKHNRISFHSKLDKKKRWITVFRRVHHWNPPTLFLGLFQRIEIPNFGNKYQFQLGKEVYQTLVTNNYLPINIRHAYLCCTPPGYFSQVLVMILLSFGINSDLTIWLCKLGLSFAMLSNWTSRVELLWILIV